MHRGDDYESLKDVFAKRIWSQVCKFYPQLEDKVGTNIPIPALCLDYLSYIQTVAILRRIVSWFLALYHLSKCFQTHEHRIKKVFYQ